MQTLIIFLKRTTADLKLAGVALKRPNMLRTLHKFKQKNKECYTTTGEISAI